MVSAGIGVVDLEMPWRWDALGVVSVPLQDRSLATIGDLAQDGPWPASSAMRRWSVSAGFAQAHDRVGIALSRTAALRREDIV
jgi:hypothetical protein